MRQLSRQQQPILVHVYQKSREAGLAAGAPGAVGWGVEGDRAFQASTSRSLKRLESRSLVRRLHCHQAVSRPRVPITTPVMCACCPPVSPWHSG
jgi:hypothetical protein